MTPLGRLDRLIAAALLRDGRASWRRIAAVLDEPERRVARHGARLLETGAVRVKAQENPRNRAGGQSTFLRVRCVPRALPSIAARMAADDRTLWVSVLAGPSEAVGEYLHGHGDLAGVVAGVAEIDGVEQVDARPELRFHRTVSGWAPGILDDAQLEALRQSEDVSLAAQGDYRQPDATNRALISLLSDNGRATVDELAGALGTSKSTVSRRLDAAVSGGQVFIRAMVDPALLGFPVETVVSASARPRDLDHVGAVLASLPETRWAVDDGSCITAQLAHRDRDHLRTALSRVGQDAALTGLTVSPVIEIAKRSGVRYIDGEPEPLQP
ncbi:AsnC family transcriptional regulator [Microbacterium marinilacus]|nr:AsnC family transcriptional regulator [Microbacterium marinilacus]MBY0687376.1 AsnC family transcriptional regulator [Microbacterium marinilacus]